MFHTVLLHAAAALRSFWSLSLRRTNTTPARSFSPTPRNPGAGARHRRFFGRNCMRIHFSTFFIISQSAMTIAETALTLNTSLFNWNARRSFSSCNFCRMSSESPARWNFKFQTLHPLGKQLSLLDWDFCILIVMKGQIFRPGNSNQ